MKKEAAEIEGKSQGRSVAERCSGAADVLDTSHCMRARAGRPWGPPRPPDASIGLKMATYATGIAPARLRSISCPWMARG